ncbi:MAG: MazG nucleotide pyrophosphohydrolase domain-containing protein [Gemmatimonadota bacterium]|nr:MazG nucleotide pyrophosphohydrolase domain-containing protein [Gemmatimonadota bacterium]
MQDKSALGRACAMVRDLRRRCPWDRVQTRETIRPYLVEEVFELDHAIAEGEPAAIREEVADLMLHLAWQIVLGEEQKEFTADQIAGELEAKMRRRHPHLFDLGPAVSWSKLKRSERRGGTLAGLPPALPSLVMAYRLQERAATVGFDWPDTIGPVEKVREELDEVEEALRQPEATPGRGEPATLPRTDRGAVEESGEPIGSPPTAAVIDEIGDLLFAVVNLARKARVQPATALEHANRKFRYRFEAVERLAAERGIEMATAGLEALDRLWDEVKAGRVE